MTAISQATVGSPKIEIIDRRTIGEADARAIAELIVSIWPKPERTVDKFTAEILDQWKDYHGPEAERPRSFLVRDGSRVLAHTSAYPRTIGTAKGNVTILALPRV